MGQKGYCCELLLLFCLLQGAVRVTDAQSGDTTAEPTTVTTMQPPTTTSPQSPVDVDEETSYPPEAIVRLTIQLDDDYTSENITSLNDTVLIFITIFCNETLRNSSQTSGDGSADVDLCPTVENSASSTGPDEYTVVYVDYDEEDSEATLGFVVLAPTGTIQAPIAEDLGNFLVMFLMDMLGVTAEVIFPSEIMTTDSSTTTTEASTTEEKSTGGLPVGAIVGIAIGAVAAVAIVVAVTVTVVAIVVVKLKGKSGVTKITPLPAKTDPDSATTHGKTVPMEKLPKSA